MKWTFEQKLAWAKAYMAGEFVPIPTGFSGSVEGWHHRIGKWVRVLLEYGEDGLNPSRHPAEGERSDEREKNNEARSIFNTLVDHPDM